MKWPRSSPTLSCQNTTLIINSSFITSFILFTYLFLCWRAGFNCTFNIWTLKETESQKFKWRSSEQCSKREKTVQSIPPIAPKKIRKSLLNSACTPNFQFQKRKLFHLKLANSAQSFFKCFRYSKDSIKSQYLFERGVNTTETVFCHRAHKTCKYLHFIQSLTLFSSSKCQKTHFH